MNVGVITIDFDEVGFVHDGHNFGNFTGTAEVDCDGKVIHLCIETIDRAKAFWRADVPVHFDADNLISNLAENIQDSYERTIKDKLDEWSVSIAEKGWGRSDRDEHSTLRVVRGRVG